MHALLVHGGGHGAWCWREVEHFLHQDGVTSSSFDLPGSGSDETPRSGIGLDDYIDATIARIDSIDDDVLLVGHSIAGLTLPGVMAARGNRISHALFIAALVTERGERGIDSIPEDRRPSYYAMANESRDGAFLPSFSAAWERFFPSLLQEAALTVYAQLTPQPLGPYLEPNPAAATESDVPCTYVVLEDDRTFPHDLACTFAAKAEATVVFQPGDHCWMLTDPRACASTIAEVARA